MSIEVPSNLENVIEEIWTDEPWESELSDEEMQDKADLYWISKDDYEEAINFLKYVNKVNRDIKFYSENGYKEYYELDDAHTYSMLDEGAFQGMEDNNGKIPTDGTVELLYGEIAVKSIHTVEERFKTSIFGLGRSGRHICVDINFHNWLNYAEMQEEYLHVQETMHNNINHYGLITYNKMLHN